MAANPIRKRIIYHIEIKLREPLCVSNGDGIRTDTDVIKDFDGTPFVPGSSLAGAFGQYLKTGGIESEILGSGSGEESRMSPLTISDITFHKEQTALGVRDGVVLETKQVIDKFDVEIVEPGAKGFFELELNVRENISANQAAEWENQIQYLLFGLEMGEIRLGARKNRGFGRLSVQQVRRKEFSKNNRKEWIQFTSGDYDKFDVVTLDQTTSDLLFQTFKIPLRLSGGISIRRYTVKPGEADFETITVSGGNGLKAVVPGSSWNGAIRSRAREILEELGVKNTGGVLSEWFGYVDEKAKKAKQSQICISESIIDGGTDLEIVRNKIDRFSGAVVEGNLYRERSHFEGKLDLEIKISKKCPDWQIICGLLLLIIKDIEKGYLSVGGQTAVGRGIFEGNGNWRDRKVEKEYIHAFAEFVQKRRQN